jgi:helix-turn-helix protein
MSEPLVIVEENRGLAAHLGAAKPVSASSAEQVHAAWTKYVRGAIWIAQPGPLVKLLAGIDPLSKAPHRLLLIGSPRAPERVFLRAVFESVVAPGDEIQMLKLDDLFEALGSAHRANLFIGGVVAPAARSLVLIRGDLTSLIVPFSWFVARPNGPKPDFSAFELIDGGQTIKLGDYEAAADALLYELDAEFRQQERKRRISADRSFGGALRRLRLQLGLSREDFPGLSAKTIARIERGDVKEPHGETLTRIAERLGVKPEEIASF